MRRLLSLLILLVILVPAPAHALGYEEEGKIANEVISQLDAQGVIVHDPDITWMLQSITDQLADHVKDPLYSFKIYLLDDRSINAMSIPGGVIFINYGIILLAKDMDEIASVIGHEMGHCQLRHQAQSMKSQSELTAASIVGVITGLLLSAANPQVGTAVVLSSLGGAQNVQLQYSRKFEMEADEFSRNVLKASNMDDSATTRFLMRMNAYVGTPKVPQYLLTHPYTAERIVAQGKDIRGPHPEARYWTLEAAMMGELLSEEEAKPRAQALPEAYRRLALGIAKVRHKHYQEGLTLLDGLDMPLARSWRGLALYGLGRKVEAYALLLENHQDADMSLALADMMAEKGQVDEAIKILTPFMDQNPRAAYQLGVMLEKKGSSGLSHAAFARYFFVTHNFKACAYHVDKALEDKDLDKDTREALKRMQGMVEKAQKG